MAVLPARYPPLGRMMVFVDGENLVCRYQAMLGEARVPDDRVVHEEDTLVWLPHSVRCDANVVVRATYYTYCTGADERVVAVNKQLKSCKFRQYGVPGVHLGPMIENLTPAVFWKPSRKAKRKGVDIQMTVDILSNVHLDNLDVVFLMSGDGDYKPVIKEVQRHGKHVYVAAFSSGLDKDLPLIADKFIDLDRLFFQESS